MIKKVSFLPLSSSLHLLLLNKNIIPTGSATASETEPEPQTQAKKKKPPVCSAVKLTVEEREKKT